jgi:hypothetical protein
LGREGDDGQGSCESQTLGGAATSQAEWSDPCLSGQRAGAIGGASTSDQDEMKFKLKRFNGAVGWPQQEVNEVCYPSCTRR